MEEALRESEGKYRLLMEHASDGIHTYDLDGNFTDVNTKLCEMLGYTREEMLSLNVNDLVPVEELAVAPIRYDDLCAGKTIISERRVRRKDGTLLPVEISGKMLQPGVLLGIVRDITERKAAQERLRQSERFAYSTLDALSEHIAVIDGQGVIIATNKAWRDFAASQNAPLTEVADGMNYLAVCDQSGSAGCLDAAAFAAGLREVINNTRSEFSFEYTCDTAAERLWFVARVTRFHDEGVVRIVVAHENITTQKRIEERLKRSEEWLRSIFETSRDGILVEDNESVIYVNKAYARLFGYEGTDELIGTHISLVVSFEDRERMLEYGRRRVRGEPVITVYEFKGIRKDGALIDLEAAVSVTNIDGKDYITTAVRDIAERKRAEQSLRQAKDELEKRVEARTVDLAHAIEVLQSEINERRRAEETLRENEQRLKIALETSKLGSWQLDVETGVFHASEICKANFGLPPEAALSYRTFFELIHPHDRDRVREAVAESLKNNTEYDAEYRHVWPDGSTHWIIARGRGISDADGKIIRMVGVTLDITERKQIEETRRELLRRLVAAQEEERRRIALELHDEMGQHLTAMMLSLKSLKDSHYRWSDNAQHYFQQLQQIGDQLVQQVHHLAWELRPTALDDLGLPSALRNYVEEWGERFRMTTDFHSLGFDHRRLPSQVETTLYRIVQESLTNVVKHAQASRISVILELKRDHVFTLIEDNGVGFDDETSMPAPVRQRTTLGLLGMRERASLVGGTLNIESAPGEGTTVYVRIPIAQDENGFITHEKASYPHSR